MTPKQIAHIRKRLDALRPQIVKSENHAALDAFQIAQHLLEEAAKPCPEYHVAENNVSMCPYCLETDGEHEQPHCRDERRASK